MPNTKSQPVIDFCRLCGMQRELQESHIIPSFVTRYGMKTSITGSMRNTRRPNQKVQDGDKAKLLCYECEQRFSKYEDAFARSIFYPCHNQKTQSFAYDEDTFRCAISIAWRALVHLMQNDEHPPEKVRSLDRRAEKVWRHFLLGDIPSVGNLKPHLFLLGSVASDNSIYGFPPFANNYLARAVDMSLVGNKSGADAFIYVKMIRVLLLSTIARTEVSVPDTSTVKLSGGIVDASISNASAIPLFIRVYMGGQSEAGAKSIYEMSPRQIERVRRDLRANKEKIMKSESFQFFEANSEMSGEAAFEDLVARQFTQNR